MKGVYQDKNVWPFHRLDDEFSENMPANNWNILKIFLYHHFIERQCIKTSATNVVIRLLERAKRAGKKTIDMANIRAKIKLLHKKWIYIRKNEKTMTAAQTRKRTKFINEVLFKEFKFESTETGKDTRKKIPVKKSQPLPEFIPELTPRFKRKRVQKSVR